MNSAQHWNVPRRQGVWGDYPPKKKTKKKKVMNEAPICINDLRHNYGKRELYHGLTLSIEKGRVCALLGKNGVGKTTLIQILMGFMRPNSGQCRIFGELAYTVRPETRARIGLLFEKHLAYQFFSIEQIEKYTRQFYPKWKPERFYHLVDLLGLPKTHRIAHMSEGQRSQVVLGLTLAQDPELLILDDYSMGLDAGYRRLFIDYLCENLRDGEHTIIITSHVIQDMESFVDDAVFMRRNKLAHQTSLTDFMIQFAGYTIPRPADNTELERVLQTIPKDILVNTEWHKDFVELFFYADEATRLKTIQEHSLNSLNIQQKSLNMEDAFIGFTGRY